jgi:hypothetical protein
VWLHSPGPQKGSVSAPCVRCRFAERNARCVSRLIYIHELRRQVRLLRIHCRFAERNSGGRRRGVAGRCGAQRIQLDALVLVDSQGIEKAASSTPGYGSLTQLSEVPERSTP